jgi:hypothetical protein
VPQGASFPSGSGGNVAGEAQQIKTEKAPNFQEASLLSKLTHVQRLSSGKKGEFPYIPFSVGYRNGGEV